MTRALAISAAATLAVAVVAAQQSTPPASPQTHWEPYKTVKTASVPDQHLTDPVLAGAIDVHVHPDPDVYPRQADAFEIATLARARGLRGIVLKNHFTETAGLANLVRKYATPGFEVFGAVTMDLPVGGVNPNAVRYMVDVAGQRGRIVWMPTHDSEHEVRFNKENRPFVPVSRDGQLLPAVHEVIALVAKYDLTLATGHVEPEEALAILRAAKAAGVKRLVVTHPLFAPQYTWMSLDQLREAADLGGLIEITGNSIVRDPDAAPRVLAAIRAIGAKHFFVGTDSGLVGTPNVPDTLVLVARRFREAGISDDDLTVMFKDNPAFIVNLPTLRRTPPAAASAAEQTRQELDRLEAAVRAEEGVRAVKRLQYAFSHYLDAGRWSDLDSLFTADAVGTFATGDVRGRAALQQHFMKAAGRSLPGLAAGQLNAHLNLQPIITLGPDGRTARGTWHEMALLGQYGASASWAGVIYENEYAFDGSTWRISRIHAYPQYAGNYEDFGHKAPPRWGVPDHFDGAHVGVTIPDAAIAALARSASRLTPGARLADLEPRVRRLRDESDVENLQHSYGYYLDRKRYDDIADLFATGGALDSGQGTATGASAIRQALERWYGSTPLARGELFDHINLGTVVTVDAEGQTARARTTQLRQLGRNGEYAKWELGTYENRFVKEGGVWKLAAVRYVPRMQTTFEQGWAKEWTYRDVPVPAPHFANPGVPVTPLRARAAVSAGQIAASLSAIRKALDAAIAYDAVENLNSSYGYYIDESDWDSMSDTFASTGSKELTGAGVYVGRERIRTALVMRGPRGGRTPDFFTIHQLVQPVIHVSDDGNSAKARFRLFQGGGNADGSSGSWIGGIYENTATKENGEWKFGIQDLTHTFNASYRNGWAKFGQPQRGGITQGLGGAQPPNRFAAAYPPDRPIRARQYAFPEIVEPAFHYPNPVSGIARGEVLP